ncbi:MAG: energy transducer TonB, partial [Thermoanaerobaculia bacterium]
PTVEPLDITPPVPLETPAPAYPDLARRARAEGNVLVEAMIGADGSVHEARILRSASPLLNDAALEAVRRWRYSPARVGARPVSVSTSVVVTFSRRGLDRGQTP